MYTRKELEDIFNQKINGYTSGECSIIFTVDANKIEGQTDEKPKRLTFILENSGLLVLLSTKGETAIEYHMKIKNLDDLKHAVTHIDKWEDDWND